MASAEQEVPTVLTVLESDVIGYLSQLSAHGICEVTAKQVLVEALGLDATRSDFAERDGRLGTQLAAAFEMAGWTKARTMGRGETRRTVYYLSEVTGGC